MKTLLIIILITAISSCKTNNKNNANTGSTTTENVSVSENSAEQKIEKYETIEIKEPEKLIKPQMDKKPAIKQGDGTYSLVISFYSKGEGIDFKTQEQYANFLEKNNQGIAYEEARWGREGEVDYCINLNKLSSIQQKEFISETRSLLGKSNLVHINENQPCVHKR
ncbi:MAG: hypothetical protein H0V01_06385 [Bacteroidetes bacterium]|nr:hypothetical protein [Bacteroidota bacterium]HET6244307.1 hypothetical protein [Bacteroidia bacterium]